MTDATPEMPLRIWARTGGMMTSLPGGERYRIGGWEEAPKEGHTEYIRADAEAGMRRIEAIAESERREGAEVERLRGRVAELEAAISAQEDNELYTGGNLWMFWDDKANELARENVKLRSLLDECTTGLEAEVEARYPAEARKYPNEERRYRRDIEPVIRARAALGEGET